MQRIEAPNYQFYPKRISAFLGGGVAEGALWRKTVFEKTQDLGFLDIYDPYRSIYYGDDNAEEDKIQIEREQTMILKSQICAYWLPKETQNPLSLLEIGIIAGLQDIRNLSKTEQIIYQYIPEKFRGIFFSEIQKKVKKILIIGVEEGHYLRDNIRYSLPFHGRNEPIHTNLYDFINSIRSHYLKILEEK